MKKASRALVLSALLAAPLLALAPRAGGAQAVEVARVIVKYRADGALSRETIAAAGNPRAAERPQHARTLAQRTGLALRDGHVVMPRVQVLHASGLNSAALVARLQADPDVEYAEVDQRARIAAVPNDPIFTTGPAVVGTTGGPVAGQWYLRAPDATLRSAINAEGAWNVTRGSASIVVAVIDTGVRMEHPDLNPKLLPGYDFVDDDRPGVFDTAADGNGRDANPSDPGDWASAGQCGAGEGASSSSWHGTQVAGLIGAASNNAFGISGVAPNTMILPVRALGKCGGYQSDIVAGMRWAAGLSNDPVPNPNPARIVNLSLGSEGVCSETYASAVTELTNAGVAVVAAAGNEIGLPTIQPANCAGAVGVAGIRHVGSKVGYSNLGQGLTVAAPAGNCVNIGTGDACLYPLATTVNLGDREPLANGYSDSFNISVGTSFATPLVAGTAALMLAANPALSVNDLRTILRNTARPFPTTGADAGTPFCQLPRANAPQDQCYCTADTCGAGMLDAAAAVAAAASTRPVANIAFSALDYRIGQALLFDGAGSIAQPSLQGATFQWSLIQGAGIASVVGSTATQQVLSVIPTGFGAITAQLTLTDSSGRQSTATARTDIQPNPLANISGAGGAMLVGNSLTLSAADSTASGSRTIDTYSWRLTSGADKVQVEGTSSGSSIVVRGLSAGAATISLSVTDSAGATGTANTTITVEAPQTGGGGGALGWPWLLGLAVATAVLRRERPVA